MKKLPENERNENDRDLQRNNYFINLRETNEFSDHNIIDIFCDFFQQHGRFPGSQDLVVVPIQALAYYGGSTEIPRQTLSEFLHNMSHQALNKDNYNVFMQFDRTVELIKKLIFMLLDRNNRSLNPANAISNNINNEKNDYQFTFDAPTEIEIKKIWKTLKNKKTHQRCLLPMFHHHY